jgi:hypothetical protein
MSECIKTQPLKPPNTASRKSIGIMHPVLASLAGANGPNPGNPGKGSAGAKNAGAVVVGVCAFSGALRGLKWIPIN